MKNNENQIDYECNDKNKICLIPYKESFFTKIIDKIKEIIQRYKK